jgi:hypothetical protein
MTMAMVSSSADIHAERLLIAQELKRAFDDVKRAPEESVAGTAAMNYLDHARKSDFLVVLLTQKSRDAVIGEVKAAFEGHAHVAAFRLSYPPFDQPRPWVATPEEELLREKGTWVKEVASVVELVEEVWRSIAHYIAVASARVQRIDGDQVYIHLEDWLSGDVERIAFTQVTSMLFLGARSANKAERRCLDRLLAIAATPATRRRGAAKIIHVFDGDATEGKSLTGEKYIWEKKWDSLITSRRVSVRVANPASIAPAAVVNDRVALGTPLGAGGMMMTLIQDAEIAAEVYQQICDNGEVLKDKRAYHQAIRSNMSTKK